MYTLFQCSERYSLNNLLISALREIEREGGREREREGGRETTQYLYECANLKKLKSKKKNPSP